MGQLTDKDRDLVIKEARQAALHDVSQAMARVMDKYGQSDPEVRRFARFFHLCLGEKLSEVAKDAEGSSYPRVNHPSWGDGD